MNYFNNLVTNQQIVLRIRLQIQPIKYVFSRVMYQQDVDAYLKNFRHNIADAYEVEDMHWIGSTEL